MKIDIQEFFGTRPKRDRKLLDPRQAQVADNCKLWSGALRAWNANAFEYTPLGTTPVLSIYKHADAYWFESDKVVRWIQGPVHNDGGYVYSTDGQGYPQITSTTLATSGLGAYPHDSRRLGVPAPAAAPTVTANETTGTISDITTKTVENTDGSDIMLFVNDSATVRYRGNMIFEAEGVGAGFAVAQIKIGTEVIAEKKVDIAFTHGRPGEPEVRVFSFELEATHTPDADGNVTFSFTAGPSGSGLPTLTDIGSSVTASARLAGAVLVTVNVGHGLEIDDMIHIDGANGMGDFNDQKYTILEIYGVDSNELLLASDTEETYAADSSGTWTKIYPAEETESRSYVFTYISDFEGLVMEGPPSDASDVVDVFAEIGATVSFPVGPDAAWNVTGVRLYRSSTNSAGETEFLFLKEFAGAQPAAHDDTAEGKDLGEVVSTVAYDPPPFALDGLTALDNGILAGFSGNVIYPCEPYQPHAWPSDYQQTTAYNIVTLVPIGGATLAALTDGNPYVLNGRHPADMALERIDTTLACLSARAAVDMGYAAVYPADAGLVSLKIGSAAIVTRELFSRDEWQALKPDSMIAARYDDRYVCFYDTGTEQGGFVVDPQDPKYSLTFLDFHATAAWTDPRNGDLYLVVNNEIVKFDGDAANQLTYTWRSKRVKWRRPGSPAVAQVIASSYPVTLKCFMVINDVLAERWSVAVQNRNPFRVKGGELVEELELEVIGSSTVEQITVAESFEELKES